MASVEDIRKLADVKYASQTTGVSYDQLNEAYKAVGIDPTDNFAFIKANEILEQNGYKPGSGAGDFYANATTGQTKPDDEGLAIHYQAVQDAIKYGYADPNTGKGMVNDNIANAELIRRGLEERGIDPVEGTIASTPANTPEWEDIAKEKYTQEYDKQNEMTGLDLDNSLQWAEMLKNRVKTPVQSGGTGFGDSLQPGPLNQPNIPTPDPIPETVNDAVTLPVTPPTYAGNIPTGLETVYREEAGTFSSPLQTANLSAVPESVTVRPQYTGTTMRNLTMPSQGQYGVQNVVYSNDFGQTVTVTEVNGKPTTYVPPGYTRQAPPTEEVAAYAGGLMRNSYAQGGLEGGDRELDAMYRMATRFLGYRGPKTRKALDDFAKSSPAAASKLKAYGAAMAKGGLMRKGYAPGGMVTAEEAQGMSGDLLRQTFQPRQSTVAMITPQAADFIAPTAGQTVPQAPFAEAATVGTVEQAMLPTQVPAAQVTPTTTAGQVQQQTAELQAAQGQMTPQSIIQAAQQEGTSVSNIQAAQGQAIMMDNPVQRQIQQGELISGAADAAKAAEFTEQIQAAEATPSKQATVAGQLETLMAQFEGGETPAWAAGSMRQATQMLAARGLGASSLAGQAVIQAAMEAALPVAQMDAQTQAQFEAQNLSNRQQRAMLAAQQRAQFLGQEFDQAFQARVQNSARIGDIANMNFTAEQQVALENSRAANTVNLQNLSNRQAKVMAEAAALSQLDMANLNNRQQEAVQNAQNFLQMDMANLSNEQQTALFRSQQNIQALFTDQAAQNAAAQFNASSENQTNQFFASLANQTAQFNASQRNALDQFNVNSVNALREFNSEIQQQRDLFNAQNGLVIAQANAQWRQNIATLNTATQNESNMNFAQTMNALTSTNLDNIWQRERDIMSYAFTQSESAMDRALNILLADKELEAFREKMANDEESAKWAVATNLFLS